jgi:hypothetical protein
LARKSNSATSQCYVAGSPHRLKTKAKPVPWDSHSSLALRL